MYRFFTSLLVASSASAYSLERNLAQSAASSDPTIDSLISFDELLSSDGFMHAQVDDA